MEYLKITTIASSSEGNCHLIDDGCTKLLLDAGVRLEGVKKALLFNLTGIDGVLITHEHQDHARAVRGLSALGIRCYATELTLDALGMMDNYFTTAVQKLQTIRIGSYYVMAFGVDHDAVDPVGWLVQSQHSGAKLLYVTDTYKLNYNFSGITHLMIECNYIGDLLEKYIESSGLVYLKRIYSTHMELEMVVKILGLLKDSKFQEIHLLHLSDGNSDEERMKKRIQEVTGAVVRIAPKYMKGVKHV